MDSQIQGRNVPEEAVKAVLTHYSVLEAPINLDDIMGGSRAEYVVRVRQMVMYVLKDVCGLSYPVIGRILDRDHTTILSGVRRVHLTTSAEEIEEVREYVQARLDRQKRSLRTQMFQEVTAP